MGKKKIIPSSLITYARKAYQFTKEEEEQDEIEKDIWKLENLDIPYKKNLIKKLSDFEFHNDYSNGFARRNEKKQFMSIYIMKRLQRSAKK